MEMRSVMLRLLLICLAFATPLAAAPTASGPSTTPTPNFLKPGEVVAPFDAIGIDGVTRHIAFPNKGVMIVVFFSSGCPHCHKMIPEWNKRFVQRASNVAMIGIIADKEPPGFFEQVPIAFPVLRASNPNLLRDYKVERVPLTLRIAPGGVVEEVGVGILDPIRLGQIFR
jgi:thiol-disulfide isomerase/thioredoxin